MKSLDIITVKNLALTNNYKVSNFEKFLIKIIKKKVLSKCFSYLPVVYKNTGWLSRNIFIKYRIILQKLQKKFMYSFFCWYAFYLSWRNFFYSSYPLTQEMLFWVRKHMVMRKEFKEFTMLFPNKSTRFKKFQRLKKLDQIKLKRSQNKRLVSLEKKKEFKKTIHFFIRFCVNNIFLCLGIKYGKMRQRFHVLASSSLGLEEFQKKKWNLRNYRQLELFLGKFLRKNLKSKLKATNKKFISSRKLSLHRQLLNKQYFEKKYILDNSNISINLKIPKKGFRSIYPFLVKKFSNNYLFFSFPHLKPFNGCKPGKVSTKKDRKDKKKLRFR